MLYAVKIYLFLKKIRIALGLKKINFENLFSEKLRGVSLEDLEKTYSLLKGDYSKKLFVDLISMRVIGGKISLDIEANEVWRLLPGIEKNMKDDVIKTKNYDLNLHALGGIGFPINMYNTPMAIFTDFILKQYEFCKYDIVCKVERGDFVIDGGGCFGDTALYFSYESGDEGKVFSFEFIKENIDIFNKNVSLNPNFRKNINLVQYPLWSAPGKNLYVINDGPASKVLLDKPDGDVPIEIIKTISIDEFVKVNNIKKIDFIKLDIEGAEPEALCGAEWVIRKFRPKLAICLYHDIQHFSTIPSFIDGLNLNYDFYLDHFTPHFGETVLFANPR